VTEYERSERVACQHGFDSGLWNTTLFKVLSQARTVSSCPILIFLFMVIHSCSLIPLLRYSCIPYCTSDIHLLEDRECGGTSLEYGMFERKGSEGAVVRRRTGLAVLSSCHDEVDVLT